MTNNMNVLYLQVPISGTQLVSRTTYGVAHLDHNDVILILPRGPAFPFHVFDEGFHNPELVQVSEQERD